MPMHIVKGQMTRADLAALAKERFGDMVKAVVDIKRRFMAVGGELHADEEQLLLEDGSAQADLWGINLYPEVRDATWLEYDSMINIRPSVGNRSRGVEDADLRGKIAETVCALVRDA